MILDYLKNNPGSDMNSITSNLHLSSGTAYRVIEDLVQEKKVKRIRPIRKRNQSGIIPRIFFLCKEESDGRVDK